MDSEREQKFQNRARTQERVDQMVLTGQHHLEGSHLFSNEQPLDHVDVEWVRTWLREGLPITVDNFRAINHSFLAGKVAREIGEALVSSKSSDIPKKFKNLNLNELEILGYLHDMGKPVAGFRFYREEMVGIHVLRKLGIRSDLVDKMMTIKDSVAAGRLYAQRYGEFKDYLAPDDVVESDVEAHFQNLLNHHPEQMIVTIADILSKRNFEDWSIVPFEEVLDHHYKVMNRLIEEQKKAEREGGGRADDNSKFPSEQRAYPSSFYFDGLLYQKIRNWLEENKIDTRRIQESIMEAEKRKSATVVLFDIGNVLFDNPDPNVFDAMTKAYGVSLEDLQLELSEFVPLLQSDTIDTEEFYRGIANKLGVTLPSKSIDLLNEGWSVEPCREIVAMIDTLRGHGMQVAAFTDTVRVQMERSDIKKLYKHFSHVIASPDTGLTKRNIFAFGCAATILDVSPASIVFIDDKEEYINKARQIGMKGIVFTSPQQLREDLRRFNIDV